MLVNIIIGLLIIIGIVCMLYAKHIDSSENVEALVLYVIGVALIAIGAISAMIVSFL